MKTARVALLVAFALPVASQTGGDLTVRLHVVDSVTHASIAGASVVWDSMREHERNGETDADGDFIIQAPPGRHTVTVIWRAHRMVSGEAMASTVEAKIGSLNSWTIEMVPPPVVTGRVIDQFGDPLPDAIVHVLGERSPLPDGNRYFAGFSSSLTNDHGEYRLYNVAPGRHYIMAEYSSVSGDRMRQGGMSWPELGGYVLYPEGADINQSRQVEVYAGQVKRLDDLRLPARRSVAVHGRVSAVSAKGATITVKRAGPLLESSIFPSAGSSGFVNADGSFRVEVLPGKYLLTATDSGTGKKSQPFFLEARDQEIGGIELETNTSFEVAGKIVVEGEPTDLTKIYLVLANAPVKIDAQGVFHERFQDGLGQIFVQGLPEGAYLKDVVVGNQHVSGRSFTLKPGTSEMLVRISRAGAEVEVVVQPDESSPVMYVTLLPDDGSPLPPADQSLVAEADGTGRFVIRGVPPGTYRVVALGPSNYVLIMNPAMLMDKLRSTAPQLTVAEGERKSITVKPSSAPVK